MRNATGPLAATSPRPFTLKAAVAALAGIGLLSTPCVRLLVRCLFNQSSRYGGVLIGIPGIGFGVVAAV